MSKDKRSVVTKYTTKVGSIEVPPNSTIELDRDEAEDKLRRGLVREPGGGNSEGDAARLKPEGDELVKAIAFNIRSRQGSGTRWSRTWSTTGIS